jgi:hypothetical protein
MGIVIFISLMLVFVLFIVAKFGFGNEIFLLPFALGLFINVLVYCGILFLINYAYQYLKNSALHAQDDTKAHKYTIYTILFVSFLLLLMFVNMFFVFVRKIKGKYHFAKNIRL